MVRKLNIYFIHSKAIKERESVIENFSNIIKKYRFKNIVLSKVHIVEDFDPSDIDIEVIRKYVEYSKIEESHVEFYNQLLRNMHVNQLSNSLKHFKAIEMISNSSNDGELNLILEDDVLFEDKVCLSLERVVSLLPHQFDIILLGMPTVGEVQDKSTYIFEDTHKIFKVLPVCDSYFISHSASKALVVNYSPIKFTNNIQLSYVCDKLGMSIQQAVPNIFIDGSKYGLFLSKLSTNNPLIFNNDFINLRSIISKDQLTKEDISSIDNILQRSTIKNNPDFIHLECGYLVKQKEYKKAVERYQLAFNTYMHNGCILANDSVFLRDYIRVHKYIQPDLQN